MNKTPVSILQEMMMKKKSVPNYELIHDGGGTHDNTFTYQVSCDELVAHGTGRCKKDAKHEAAKKMLETIAAHNNYPQLQASPAPSPIKKPLITEVTVSPKRAANMPFLNAVGALTQICADNNLQAPEYEEVDGVGPPHARIFTVECIVATFREEGIATTKKQAKHEAARKMLEKIQVVVEDMGTSGELELRDEEAKLQESFANDIALERYSVLTKIPHKKVNLGLQLEDYHRNLKKIISEDIRSGVLIQLNDLNEYIDKAGTNDTEDFVDALRDKLIEFLEPLNLTYFCKKMETNSTNKCLVLSQISTNPDITEIGVADEDYLAEKNGIKLVIQEFTTLLS